MRVSIVIVMAAALMASCQDDEPSFAPAGSIRDRRFPGEATTTTQSLFPKPFDDATPPVEPALATRHKTFAVLEPRTDCMACHGPSGVAGKKWLFGGHVAAKKPGAVVEVILTTADQKTALAHVKAAADGYVWAPKTGADLPNDARVAVRTKEESATMSGAVSTPGCNAMQCHGGVTPPVTVPK